MTSRMLLCKPCELKTLIVVLLFVLYLPLGCCLMSDEDCPEPMMRKFLALVKVEGIPEPNRYEEFAANWRSLKR